MIVGLDIKSFGAILRITPAPKPVFDGEKQDAGVRLRP